MKRIALVFVTVIMLLLPLLACAQEIIPYASEEINAAGISFSTRKKITYSISVTSSSYTVHINYCDLYKQTASKVWTRITSMPNGVPDDVQGDMIETCDISDYITESGTYRVKASITVGSSTITRTSNSQTF